MIYRAGTQIGKAFSLYLAEKNFGLILVDFDLERLKSVELEIQRKLQRHYSLKMIVLSPKND